MAPEIHTEALQMFSAEEAQFYRLLPFAVDASGTVRCLGEKGRDYSAAIREIQTLFGKKIEVLPTTADELSRLLVSSYRATTTHTQGELPKEPAQMISFLIEDAHKMRASDIHLEPQEQNSRIRYRIDGKLLERYIILASDYTALVNRVKILSNLDISEKRLPQDGRILFSLSGGGRTF